ncbi:hypothetical protein ABB37_08414 [Leptomonas pyrrhocoris]|uniref:Uncharacterized protein n=1 Tax=Leptomonas pyrrhocoris TaxID=157538 RepID=A0A0M9FT32_LEPPY|nr:hypothetical protein ABB37_08414 [Leptomonas pyrrhocoris]XP_015653958.1 hypothetical protein ABB37_08414 [Leptomonas pyrrhocoris]XP_015653959.1 hypothetical protein ABB37_08414 [Leptomonas pyrrhocoris]KPA75518.1 hypothetical protein ABB37_08414 [Leptomonas pyrrhocoris]KPA75519.1 hypothetical protein ABB37_08414 [Leptomonas pyrrhocoris]KPA75520.1 hypothetical protein ABB37_08414 [Leptomonas pyrrhocoris]|eukprot:XP_015653957.1 hypothetical protein ABB37_08414 [Leptomonas pyrrhocoris]
MPFYNVTADETRAISDFTERHTSRTTMTFVGGQKSPVRTREENIAESATPYLDYVVGVVEAVLRRHALTCVAPEDSNAEEKANQQQQSSPYDVSASTHTGGERPYPFPSLFLHTPQQLVDMQDAVAGSGRTQQQQPPPPSSSTSTSSAAAAPLGVTPSHGCGGGAWLSSVHCTPNMPPVDILYTQSHTGDTKTTAAAAAAAATGEGASAMDDFSMVPAPLPCATANLFPRELRRHAAAMLPNPSLDAARRMMNVSLTPAKASATTAATQQMVQVVLQGEAGLVVAAPPPPPPPPPATAPRTGGSSGVDPPVETVTKMDEAVMETPFLLSPDATSCVLVACRVTLHPVWQRAAETCTSLPALQAAFPGDASARAALLRACLCTSTACMIHLDRTAGVTAALQEMVWAGALPAFVHAVHEHYRRIYATSTLSSSSSPAGALRLLHETLQAVSRAVGCSSAPSSGRSAEEAGAALPAPASAPLLHVDWYVVGGIRMKECAAPVLAAVFRAFFPRSPAPPPTPSSPASAVLLQEQVELQSVLGCSAEPGEEFVLRLAHRLREEGQCFWSFNTTFQPWCVDPNPKKRYAYPMTWGLLLSVATGHCWPATVQPGTRMIPLQDVRGIAAQHGYRWITPLESDSAHDAVGAGPHRHRDGHASNAKMDESVKHGQREGVAEVCDGGLVVVCNTVPSETVAQRMNTMASAVPPEQRLWSEFQVYRGSGTSSPSSSRMLLSLASYVRTALARQEAWWARRTSAATAAAVAPSLQRVLPVLLRRHGTASSTGSGQDNKSEEEGGKEEGLRWDRLSADVMMDVLSQPQINFLSSSTTPHCEPPDFCDLVRNQLLWHASVSSADVFVEDTDGLYVE